jgi:predicted GIY-YIG superfamily endonuclease
MAYGPPQRRAQLGEEVASAESTRKFLIDPTQSYRLLQASNARQRSPLALYTGVTNDLRRRVLDHKRKLPPGLTREYNFARLIYIQDLRRQKAAGGRGYMAGRKALSRRQVPGMEGGVLGKNRRQ